MQRTSPAPCLELYSCIRTPLDAYDEMKTSGRWATFCIIPGALADSDLNPPYTPLMSRTFRLSSQISLSLSKSSHSERKSSIN